jgi:hypothetical protein
MPVREHDGRSGASIETGLLDHTTRVYVKTAPVEHDIGALITGSATRERDLLEAGVFDHLPPGVTTPLVGVEIVDGSIVTVSRDVSAAMLTWGRVLPVTDVACIFRRIAEMHRTFTAEPPDGLCPVEFRLNLFGPAQRDVLAIANPDLAAAVDRGWELFADLAPPAVVAAVERSLRDPAPLAAAMSKGGVTLLHGDFWLVNIALDGHVLVLLDWGLATLGPSPLDFITFCTGSMSNVAMSRDALLTAARRACGDLADDDTWRLAEFWGLMELGWNKALDAIDHADAAKRATERADLDFWVGRALAAMEAGLVP